MVRECREGIVCFCVAEGATTAVHSAELCVGIVCSRKEMNTELIRRRASILVISSKSWFLDPSRPKRAHNHTIPRVVENGASFPNCVRTCPLCARISTVPITGAAARRRVPAPSFLNTKEQ